MSHLWNPLATAQQLEDSSANNAFLGELQDSIRFYTARLTQAAGVLLRLPQDIAAQAVVVLMRFWVMEKLMQHEFSISQANLLSFAAAQDVSAASIYLTAKVSASPRSLRSITNVYAYLLAQPSPLLSSSGEPSPPPARSDPEAYYLSESAYTASRTRILALEGQLLYATGFVSNLHVSLPHPLAITYLQALDCFSAAAYEAGVGPRVARRAVAHLNAALLSPQVLFLTHQPNALAVAAVYMAAREEGVKLPRGEWWEVFDVEREELGFLCLAMGSLEGWVAAERELWGERAMITRADVRCEMKKRGNGSADEMLDEEAEMGSLLDQKFA